MDTCLTCVILRCPSDVNFTFTFDEVSDCHYLRGDKGPDVSQIELGNFCEWWASGMSDLLPFCRLLERIKQAIQWELVRMISVWPTTFLWKGSSKHHSNWRYTCEPSHTHSYQIYQSTLYCWLSLGAWQTKNSHWWWTSQKQHSHWWWTTLSFLWNSLYTSLSKDVSDTFHRWCMQSTYSCGSISAEKTRYHWSAVGEVFLCTFVGGWPLVSQIPSWDPWQDWH